MKEILDKVKHKVKAFFVKKKLQELIEKKYVDIPDIDAETTEEKIAYLRQLRRITSMGGGEARQKAQHEKGKFLARERIDKLLDKDSFVEIDKFVTHHCSDFGLDNNKIPGDGVIGGHGTINGRTVFIYAQDFTVLGGSLGEMQSKKICKIMDAAANVGAPIICLNDSGGARIQEGVSSLAGYAEIFYRNTIYSGVIPQIALILGPCAGGAVYSPGVQDFIIMVKKTSFMFITGPEVIKTVTSEKVSFEELGGADIHSTKSGVASLEAESEDEAFLMLKHLISYLPDNNLCDPPSSGDYKTDTVRLNALQDLIPSSSNKPYSMFAVIEGITDKNTFFEIFPSWAVNIIIGFARIEGMAVGIIANNVQAKAGVLDIDSSIKAARFIRFCDAFNIPIITLQDVPGFLPGVAQEHNGIIRNGAKLLFAYAEATVPKITVIIRKSYGGAYCVMNSKQLRSDLCLAWPSAEIAVMGPMGAVNIIFRKDIANSENPEEKRQELVKDYTEKFANPYIAAQKGYIDDVVEPRETRSIIANSLRMLSRKRSKLPAKKHGNIPL